MMKHQMKSAEEDDLVRDVEHIDFLNQVLDSR